MRLIFVFSLLTVAAAQAEQPASANSPQPGQAITIPDGAVQTAPYVYRYTDKDGKKWFYSETPFGVMRSPDEPKAAPPKAEPDGIRAFEDGDAVRFERLGPFGIYHWTKKKSELDAGEQAALDRERARIEGQRY